MATSLTLLLISIHMLICVSAQWHQKHNNITLGSTLIANSKNSKWVSPNTDFAFGFYPISSTQYLVAVWFDNISAPTVAWTAMENNRVFPVEEGSTLKLTEQGIQLYDYEGRNLKWSIATNEKVSAAAMLDSGNFRLFDVAFRHLWQSFDYPTDTLLPGQTLQWRSTLYSKASDTNYSSGRFELALQEDGNLVLYPVDRVNEAPGAYWATGTYKSGDNPCNLNFDASGLLSMVNSTNITVWQANVTARSRNLLRRVTLDANGILGQYVWNKDEDPASSSWSSVWQAVNDPCKDVKGQCGRNGICGLTAEGKPTCTCPPGFYFIEREDPFKGCLRNSSDSCTATTSMSELAGTDWTNDKGYSVLTNLSENACQQACMEDCMCVVVTYDNSVCRKKRMPLIDGRQGEDITNKAFVKVSDASRGDSPLPSTSTSLPPPQKQTEKGKKGKALFVIGLSLVGCFSTLVAAGFLFIWLCVYGRKKRTMSEQGEGLKAFTYEEIKAATGGFREELGRGAFGKVYKGALPEGKPIAVKTLHRLPEEEHGEKEFRTEVSVIGTSHHKNLVKLYGFCNDGSHKLLVYEYMCNGSLDRALFVDGGFLDWNIRVEIAVGAARGLLYLHEECTTQIIHCDIKPQNILLDDNFNSKISDFGIAKMMRAEQTRTFTQARGTKGYIAPEWHNNMPITVKVDVYSFGVMLLEIICCRKTMELNAPENQILLSDWVYGCLKQGTLMKLVEKQVLQGNTIDQWRLERMVLVGLWCIQEDLNLRPTIKKVVGMLEGMVEVAVPPAPRSFMHSSF